MSSANYELQSFRDGAWKISAIFDDRTDAMTEARRLDRLGRIVRVREETIDAEGNDRGMRTIFLSSTIKNTWKAERERIATHSARPIGAYGLPRANGGGREPTRINPYMLLTIFTGLAFLGLGAIMMLRTLYVHL
jgi:hypothetical protein